MIQAQNSLFLVRLRAIPPWALVALTAFVVHSPGLFNGYTMDDEPAVWLHPGVNGEGALTDVFTKEWWGRPLPATEYWSSSYRPLTTLTLALSHRLTPAPWLPHLINILLFAVLAALTSRTARRWCSDRIALVVGLLFAALPLHVENVASIVGRADTLAALFCLASFTLLENEKLRPISILGACLLYLCGLLSKESVALFPAIVLWLETTAQCRTPRSRPFFRRFIPGLALGATGLLYLAFRQQFLPVTMPAEFPIGQDMLHGVHGAARIWGNLGVLGRYAELTFVPWRLCADHGYADFIPSAHLFDNRASWSWLGLVLLVPIYLSARNALIGKGPGLGVAFFLSYLLVGHWLVDIVGILAERLALWPSVWLAFAVGAFMEKHAKDIQRPRLLRVLIGTLLVLFSFKTATQSLKWHDNITLFATTAAVCPKAALNRKNLAVNLSKAGFHEEAVWQFAVASTLVSTLPFTPEFPALYEGDLPIEERLIRLPELLDEPDPNAVYGTLHEYFLSRGMEAERRIIERLVQTKTHQQGIDLRSRPGRNM